MFSCDLRCHESFGRLYVHTIEKSYTYFSLFIKLNVNEEQQILLSAVRPFGTGMKSSERDAISFVTLKGAFAAKLFERSVRLSAQTRGENILQIMFRNSWYFGKKARRRPK